MSLKKFLNMDDNSFSNFLSFCYDNIILMKSAYSKIADKIEYNLHKFYFNLVQDFQNKYILYFDLMEYYFSHNFNHPTLSLYIKFEFRPFLFDNIDFSKSSSRSCSIYFSFCYIYKKSNEKYMISWKLDLTEEKVTNTWILSECQEVNIYILDIIYFFILNSLRIIY
jgi:hypothetical protein